MKIGLVIEFPKSHSWATVERVFIIGLMVWKCVNTAVCVVVSMCVYASACMYAQTYTCVFTDKQGILQFGKITFNF